MESDQAYFFSSQILMNATRIPIFVKWTGLVGTPREVSGVFVLQDINWPTTGECVWVGINMAV